MMKNLLDTLSWRGLLLLLGCSAVQVLASQKAASTSSASRTSNHYSYSHHNDTKSFIHLPGRRSVDDVVRQSKAATTSEGVLRGGAVKQHDPIMRADYIADTKLPTDMGNFRMRAYRVRGHDDAYSNTNAMEPIIIYAADKPPFGTDGQLLENVPVRIHDQCLTSEVFRSRRCDCKEQLQMSMDYVQKHGGAVIYLQQEGRGIGLANKLAAYELQDHGLDTVDANLQLGFPDDARQYGVLPSIFRHMRVSSIRLMTNNPRKVHRLSALGITIVDTIPILAHPNVHNRKYLETKKERMAHTNFGHILANEARPVHAIVQQPKHPGMMPLRPTPSSAFESL